MNKPLVLIVEDDLIVAMDIKEILNQQGYKAIVNVGTIDDAITVIEESNPSLVLIDINLKQDKDGIHLGMYLLEKDKIPYVFITAYPDKLTLERVKLTRPYGFIVKPFRSEDIITTISIVLNNFKHRYIDVTRQNREIKDDIPFVLKQSINFINLNINEKIKVSDLAKQTRWESQHYNRLFAKYIGVTPYKFIQEKKIEKAKLLLTETTIPITQVSFELGFKSHSNFCSIFKKATAKTPEGYRKWNEINDKYIK